MLRKKLGMYFLSALIVFSNMFPVYTYSAYADDETIEDSEENTEEDADVHQRYPGINYEVDETILDNSLSFSVSVNKEYEYKGKAIEPGFSDLTFTSGTHIYKNGGDDNGDYDLKELEKEWEEGHLVAAYKDNLSAGTGKIAVYYTDGAEKGSAVAEFKIKNGSTSGNSAELGQAFDHITDDELKYYGGYRPKRTISDRIYVEDENNNAIQITPYVDMYDTNGKLLKMGEDYELSWGTNDHIGTGTVTVTGKGSYASSSSKSFSFNINAEFTVKIFDDSGNAIEDNGITSYKKQPVIKVVDAVEGKNAIDSSYYTISYAITDKNGKKTEDYDFTGHDASEGDTVSVIVTGKGTYQNVIHNASYSVVKGKFTTISMDSAFPKDPFEMVDDLKVSSEDKPAEISKMLKKYFHVEDEKKNQIDADDYTLSLSSTMEDDETGKYILDNGSYIITAKALENSVYKGNHISKAFSYTYSFDIIADNLMVHKTVDDLKFHVELDGETLSSNNYTMTTAVNIEKESVQVTVKGLGQYKQTITIQMFSFQYRPWFSNVTAAGNSYKYTGSEITPAVTVYDTAGRIVDPSNYTVKYENNKEAGTAKITVNGIGDYSGQEPLATNFKIYRGMTVSEGEILFQDYNSDEKVYPSPTIMDDVTGEVLKKDTDYTLTRADYNDSYAGEILVTGINRYEGATLTVPFTIVLEEIRMTSIGTITQREWTGEEITPPVTVYDQYEREIDPSHYTVGYTDNIEIGTATVTIYKTDSLIQGSNLTTTFEIVAPGTKKLAKIDKIDDQYADGTYLTPAVKVYDGNGDEVKSSDYVLSYSNNKGVGTATVKADGQNAYIGSSVTGTFKIINRTGSLGSVKVPDYSYTGKVITPSVTVYDSNGTTLAKNVDYTYSITPSEIKNAGKYTVTVTGINGFSGTTSSTFNVRQKEIDSVRLQSSAYNYTGTALKPKAYVYTADGALLGDALYSLSYSNNIEIGTAKVTATGKGTVTGSASTTFEIVKEGGADANEETKNNSTGDSGNNSGIIDNRSNTDNGKNSTSGNNGSGNGSNGSGNYSEDNGNNSATNNTGRTLSVGLNANNGTFKNGRSFTLVTMPSGETATFPEPSRDGWTFSGWYYINGTKYVSGSISSSITLIAHWTNDKTGAVDDGSSSSQHIVVIDDGNGNISYIIVDKDGTITLTTPERAGYIFLGWYDENGKKYNSGDKVSSDLTLIAKWKKIESSNQTEETGEKVTSVNVGLDANEGTFPDGSETIVMQTTDTGKIAIPEAVREGWTLLGWYYPDEREYKSSDVIKSVTILTAWWKNDTTGEIDKTASRKVLIDFGDGTSGFGKVNDDGTITLETPTREGYIFTGWYYSDGNEYKPSDIINGSTIIIAHWRKGSESAVSDYNRVIVSGNGIVLSDYSVLPMDKYIIHPNATILTKKTYYLKPSGITAKTYEYEKSSAINVTKKGKIVIRKPGTYTVTLTDSNGKAVIYTIRAENPTMSKITLSTGANASVKDSLTGADYLLPTAYNKSNKKVNISSNGIVSGASKGSSKVSIFYGSYRITGKVKVN